MALTVAHDRLKPCGGGTTPIAESSSQSTDWLACSLAIASISMRGWFRVEGGWRAVTRGAVLSIDAETTLNCWRRADDGHNAPVGEIVLVFCPARLPAVELGAHPGSGRYIISNGAWIPM